jgi:hypothetical protein
MAGAILTLGLGSFGGVNLLPTLGYVAGDAAEVVSGPFRVVAGADNRFHAIDGADNRFHAIEGADNRFKEMRS